MWPLNLMFPNHKTFKQHAKSVLVALCMVKFEENLPNVFGQKQLYLWKVYLVTSLVIYFENRFCF